MTDIQFNYIILLLGLSVMVQAIASTKLNPAPFIFLVVVQIINFTISMYETYF